MLVLLLMEFVLLPVLQVLPLLLTRRGVPIRLDGEPVIDVLLLPTHCCSMWCAAWGVEGESLCVEEEEDAVDGETGCNVALGEAVEVVEEVGEAATLAINSTKLLGIPSNLDGEEVVEGEEDDNKDDDDNSWKCSPSKPNQRCAVPLS